MPLETCRSLHICHVGRAKTLRAHALGNGGIPTEISGCLRRGVRLILSGFSPLRSPDERAREQVKLNEADASLVLSSGTYPDLRDPAVAETPRDGGGPSAPNDERVQRIESESHMHQGTAWLVCQAHAGPQHVTQLDWKV